jgi:hypothetical protein
MTALFIILGAYIIHGLLLWRTLSEFFLPVHEIDKSVAGQSEMDVRICNVQARRDYRKKKNPISKPGILILIRVKLGILSLP